MRTLQPMALSIHVIFCVFFFILNLSARNLSSSRATRATTNEFSVPFRRHSKVLRALENYPSRIDHLSVAFKRKG